jgi:hypothetical protein
MKEKIMSVKELYEVQMKEVNEQLYNAYNRITELVNERRKMIGKLEKILIRLETKVDLYR